MRQRKRKDTTDTLIERAYYAGCAGVQINMMDIPRIFRHGRDLLANGVTGDALRDQLRAFVETIRVTP